MPSAHAPGIEVIGAEVPGGLLAVELISGRTEPVLAIHGITSQRKLWNWLRAADPGLGLIAPDLRGRGDSVDHASSIMSPPGARASAELTNEALTAGAHS
jgi:pimeloyl-ACP methyl ester carboxylesterase